MPPASDQPPQKKRKLSQAEKQTILEEIEAPAPKAKKQKVDTPKSAQEKSETSSDSESDSDSDSDSESSEGEEDVVGEENEEKQETEGASVTKLLPVTEEGGAFGKFAKKIILHTQFQEAFEDIKNLVLIQKQRLELFKKQCPKHELKKDEKVSFTITRSQIWRIFFCAFDADSFWLLACRYNLICLRRIVLESKIWLLTCDPAYNALRKRAGS